MLLFKCILLSLHIIFFSTCPVWGMLAKVLNGSPPLLRPSLSKTFINAELVLHIVSGEYDTVGESTVMASSFPPYLLLLLAAVACILYSLLPSS